MADVAAVFHWQPPVMDSMSVSQLMGWHARAIERLKALNGIED
ncbi:GpE family phage tail protein [Sphingomonas sp. R1]|nr:GpE family phage tail protein [Sphingomonas sp. R1]UYY79217.1 GpE family phage tail protein [Sphingomonas sp. R1]